jgi:phospholipid/cholesterol/gamma-HCH transport system substrate-binding protein
MGRRANPTLIGAFIIGAVVLIVIGILVLGRGHFFSETRTFVLFFDGSIKGLNVGSPVEFQGVRIGSVTDIRVRYVSKTGEFRTPVYIQIDTNRIGGSEVRQSREARLKFLEFLIQRGLRAQLEVQSLVTGQLIVQLGFYPDTPVRLVGEDPEVQEMPTIPTALQQVQATAQDIIEKVRELPLEQLFMNVLETMEGTNRLVNSPEVTALVRAMSETMTDVQRLVRQVDSQMGRVLDDVSGTSTASRALMTDLQQLVRRLDGQIVPLTDSAKQTLEAARVVLKDGQQLARNADTKVSRMAESITDTAKAAQATMATAQRRVDDNLVAVVQEMTAALRSIRLLADFLERNPNALLTGRREDRR